MNIRELAPKVFATTDRPGRTKTGSYYMTNINHPVIASLKRRYCLAKGIKPYIPMSDQERTEFELWLFKPLIRQTIECICGEKSGSRLEAEICKNIELDIKEE